MRKLIAQSMNQRFLTPFSIPGVIFRIDDSRYTGLSIKADKMAAAIGYPPEPNASEGAHQRYEIKRLKYLKAYNALLFIRLMQVQDALPGRGPKGSGAGVRARPARRRGLSIPRRHSYPTKITDNKVIDSFRNRKAHRSIVARATWTNHDNKHLKARTLEEARDFSMGPRGAAQYLPNVNNKALEKLATIKGHVKVQEGNTIYFYYKFQKNIGYDGGVATKWIRAEISSGTLHGHPMRYERLPKEVRDSYRGIDL